ncbi:MAG: hypothetical protein Q9192_007852, partial [Flavoplaca navasiana]
LKSVPVAASSTTAISSLTEAPATSASATSAAPTSDSAAAALGYMPFTAAFSAVSFTPAATSITAISSSTEASATSASATSAPPTSDSAAAALKYTPSITAHSTASFTPAVTVSERDPTRIAAAASSHVPFTAASFTSAHSTLTAVSTSTRDLEPSITSTSSKVGSSSQHNLQSKSQQSRPAPHRKNVPSTRDSCTKSAAPVAASTSIISAPAVSAVETSLAVNSTSTADTVTVQTSATPSTINSRRDDAFLITDIAKRFIIHSDIYQLIQQLDMINFHQLMRQRYLNIEERASRVFNMLTDTIEMGDMLDAILTFLFKTCKADSVTLQNIDYVLQQLQNNSSSSQMGYVVGPIEDDRMLKASSTVISEENQITPAEVINITDEDEENTQALEYIRENHYVNFMMLSDDELKEEPAFKQLCSEQEASQSSEKSLK